MPKFFVVSDIHGFYDEFKSALDKFGFDPNNENHYLITCGDHFDRGSQPEQVMDYLMSLERWIGIKGNHEQLLLDCIDREYWYTHDRTNGTFQTILDLAPNALSFEAACSVVYEKTKDFMGKLVDYFETEKYIFVHSWVPLIIEDDYPKYYTRDREYHFNPDWRNATEEEWEQARWGNPFDMHFLGFNQTGKTIVFGHWHCSTGHKMFGRCNNEFDGDAIWVPCYAEGIIGIDRCTAYTGEVNVLVLEDEVVKNNEE